MIKIKNYLSLVKFSHTIFAMPFALIGYFIAIMEHNYKVELKLFILIVLCMVLARNAAMGFNRYIDRHIDKKNPRTVTREIPSGTITPKSALFFVVLNSILFIFTTFFINRLVFFLSPIALFVVLGYSFTKKITALCHFVLGVGLALAPIGAYLSVTGEFHIIPVIFSFIVLCWVSGFDIIYALQDEEFDKTEKLNSIPVLLGRKRAMLLSLTMHFISAILVFAVGFIAEFGFWYWLGATIFTVLLFYQHTIISVNNLSRVNIAFFTTNGVASVVFAIFTIIGLYK